MGANDGSRGIAREALAEAADRVDQVDQDAEAGDQLELLAEPPPSSLDSQRETENRAKMLEHQRARGAGRPKGAQNLATRQVREFVQQVFGDPMIESARVLMHTSETLARELGCTKLEAFDRLEAIRRDLRPYFYGRMAPTDDQGNAVVPQFAMFFGGHEADPNRPPWLDDPEVRDAIEHEQNQSLSDDAEAKSHDGKSHDDASD